MPPGPTGRDAQALHEAEVFVRPYADGVHEDHADRGGDTPTEVVIRLIASVPSMRGSSAMRPHVRQGLCSAIPLARAAVRRARSQKHVFRIWSGHKDRMPVHRATIQICCFVIAAAAN